MSETQIREWFGLAYKPRRRKESGWKSDLGILGIHLSGEPEILATLQVIPHPLRAFEALCETSCFLSSLKRGDVVTTTFGGFASTGAQSVSIGLSVGFRYEVVGCLQVETPGGALILPQRQLCCEIVTITP